jgi:putative peptidoglycan lipid II flippase
MTATARGSTSDASVPPPSPPRRTGGAATIVATGILLSRVFGLARQTLMAHFLGVSAAADAFTAGFKIPQILNNLFGEGALSASFIPVYSRLLEDGREEDAGKLAGAILGLLSLVVAVAVLVGVLVTPWLIPLIAPGFDPERRALTITLVRILFPGAGLFVVASWCLGVLNSHRKFLIAYSAPILWNVAMIAALLGFGPKHGPPEMAVILAWASVAGALLQFLVQLPTAIALTRPLRVSLETKSTDVQRVSKNFVPVLTSRGVVQISGYIDQWLASFLPGGVVATLSYAQTVYLLPVSLFGMAVSAAELPEMSRATGSEDEIAAQLRSRIGTGLRQIAYFVVPSAMAFLALGDVIAGLLFQNGGLFTATESRYAWGILAGSAVGLLASTLGRLYSATYYALHDTRTPLRFALVRVALTTVLGALFAFEGPRLLGIDHHWGAAGLTASAGIAGWVEFTLLRTQMNRRIGATGLPAGLVATLWGAALAAAAAGWAMRVYGPGASTFVTRALVLAVFGLVYLSATLALGVPEARSAVRRLQRRGGSRRG